MRSGWPPTESDHWFISLGTVCTDHQQLTSGPLEDTTKIWTWDPLHAKQVLHHSAETIVSVGYEGIRTIILSSKAQCCSVFQMKDAKMQIFWLNVLSTAFRICICSAICFCFLVLSSHGLATWKSYYVIVVAAQVWSKTSLIWWTLEKKTGVGNCGTPNLQETPDSRVGKARVLLLILTTKW